MSEARDPATLALIKAARAEFAQALVAKAADLEALVTSGAWSDVRRAAHRLRGSAGVYGFDAVGAVAAALDELLSAHPAPNAGMQARIRSMVGEMRTEAERASGFDHATAGAADVPSREPS